MIPKWKHNDDGSLIITNKNLYNILLLSEKHNF